MSKNKQLNKTLKNEDNWNKPDNTPWNSFKFTMLFKVLATLPLLIDFG